MSYTVPKKQMLIDHGELIESFGTHSYTGSSSPYGSTSHEMQEGRYKWQVNTSTSDTSSSACLSFFTNNKIDVTRFKKLKLRCYNASDGRSPDSFYSRFGLSDIQYPSVNNGSFVRQVNSYVGLQTLEIDISDLTGEYYIRNEMYIYENDSGSSMRCVYAINAWLE